MNSTIDNISNNNATINKNNATINNNNATNFTTIDHTNKTIINETDLIDSINISNNFTKNSESIVNALNDLSSGIFYYFVNSKIDPFNNLLFLIYLKDFILEFSNIENAILDANGNSIVKNTLISYNNLINNRGFFPFSTYLSCNVGLDIQLFYKKDYCEYTYIQDPVDINNLNCYLIQETNQTTLINYITKTFKNQICKCDKLITDNDFCNNYHNSFLKDRVVYGFALFKKLYIQFDSTAQFIADNIILKYFYNFLKNVL